MRVFATIMTAFVAAGIMADALSGQTQRPEEPTVVVAEGERFEITDSKGWGVRHQDQSYASQSFGGMWVTHGGLLGAAADSVESVAVQQIQIPRAGRYRVWSKYQAPPYFNYLHRVEIWQGGRKVFSHDYGRMDAARIHSFFSEKIYNLPPKKQVWFPWGVDHDAAEAPRQSARLNQGLAELRLITLKSDSPAGDRYIDFVVLTTELKDTCLEWGKAGLAKSPFIYEALRATPINLRFRNVSGLPARARLNTHFGHFSWSYAAKRGAVPTDAVQPGKWSPWVNINRIVELATDEGLQVTLIDGKTNDRQLRSAPPLGDRNTVVPIEVALDPRGRRLLGKIGVPNGETVHFPVDITWNRRRKLSLSRDIAADLIQKAKSQWRKAAPQKPKYIAFYGSFSRSPEPWAVALKDALGYNTLLPDAYEHLKVDGYFQHLRNEDRLREYAKSLGPKRSNFRVCSFGDEIHLGTIDYKDPKYIQPFRSWLKKHGLTKTDLGAAPDKATLLGNKRLAWYARLFGAEQRFDHYRRLTEAAKQAFGSQVLTGANYSPHHDVLYYGNHLQWIDAFRHRAMTMFWTEDYIFVVPELPQTISFMFARMQTAVKYHSLPIHMYVMPHAPGQTSDYFRRNMLFAVGAGARHIDNFWVAPQENYSENYVSWQYPETFRAIFESIYDTAAVEPLLIGARRRPARVAIVTGKATALNEDDVTVDIAADPFLRMCHLAGNPVQNICRKDQMFLYFALRHAQVDVDLITEDDITKGNVLRNYAVVHFAGEWIDDRVVPKLEAWIRSGGVLYASTGLGIRNQFDEPIPEMLDVLGLRKAPLEKDLYHVRPLLELPLAKPIDTITMLQAAAHPTSDRERQRAGVEIPAMAFKQRLQPKTPDVIVLGRWSDGTPAVTVRHHGKGKAFAVGTAAGATYLKTGLRPVPWARGGTTNLYNPVDFSEPATHLVRMGIDACDIQREVTCSSPHVESLLLDNEKGTLLTLVNWTNEPVIKGLSVTVRLPAPPRRVFSVTHQKTLDGDFQNGAVTFKIDLAEGDFVMLSK
jgi:hypothetical protein